MPAAARESQLDEAQRAVDANPRDAVAWHRLGLLQQSLANRGAAIQSLSKAASLESSSARYQHDLGNALLDDGKIDRAITAFRRALRIDDSLAEVHNDLGTAYFTKNWHTEAEASFRRAVELKPDHGIAYANLGAALRALGRLRDGRHAYQQALFLKLRSLLPPFLRWRVGQPPAAVDSSTVDSDVHFRSAAVKRDQGDIDGAMECIRTALQLKPERAEYHIAHAELLVNAGKTDDALTAAERALQLEPGSADVHAAISAIYHPWREDLAETSARRAIDLDPESAPGHANLAAALWGQARLRDALVHAETSCRLQPADQNYRMNLALILKDLGQLGAARQHYRALQNQVIQGAGSCINMGTLALQCEGNFAEARKWFIKARATGVDPRATLSEGVVDLLDGDFGEGWRKYEARKNVVDHRENHTRYAALPAWDGKALENGRLLVYGEQGLGDEVMFASLVHDLRRRVRQITLHCDPRLESLFARSFSDVQVISTAREAAPTIQNDTTCVVAAGSLGLHLRGATADFAAQSAYLKPDADEVTTWRSELAALGPGRKIGLSWAGGIAKTGRARRSFLLAQLQPLLELPGIAWVSLQHGEAQPEVEEVVASGIRMHAFPWVTEDIDDLANLIQALDLVVSVCNTNVHLAGALGKEVLVMAPYIPEWRYGLRGERMLWYPTARVFRQRTFGDWDSVIAAVKAQLQAK